MGELCADPTPSVRPRTEVVAASGDRQSDRPGGDGEARPSDDGGGDR